MPPNREQWIADVLRAGLETHILSEPDILTHATPAVLIGSLPKDVVIRLLDTTLVTGTMSPEAVLQTATPEILSAHVPPMVIWDCLAAAAQRAGFAGDGTPEAPEAREFLRRALAQALTHAVTAPKDVVEDVSAQVLGHHFPDELKTKLLEASLAAGKMNPELIIQTLGVAEITRHAPTELVWACLARTGAPHGTAARAAVAAAVGTVEPKAEPLAPPPPGPEPAAAAVQAAPLPLPPPPPSTLPPPISSTAITTPMSPAQRAAMDLFEDDMVVEVDDGGGAEAARDKGDARKPTTKNTTRRA
ncbi:MAG TPA: hypothetical protein VNO30_45615 [Kofleriaceae bacterium]|nr:hypothetical protein [Kofleriaceae bacterium]